VTRPGVVKSTPACTSGPTGVAPYRLFTPTGREPVRDLASRHSTLPQEHRKRRFLGKRWEKSHWQRPPRLRPVLLRQRRARRSDQLEEVMRGGSRRPAPPLRGQFPASCHPPYNRQRPMPPSAHWRALSPLASCSSPPTPLPRFGAGRAVSPTRWRPAPRQPPTSLHLKPRYLCYRLCRRTRNVSRTERSRQTSGEGLATNANPTLILWFSTGTHSGTYRVRTVRRSPDIDSAQVEAFFVWIWARSGTVRTSLMWSFAKDEEIDTDSLVSARYFTRDTICGPG